MLALTFVILAFLVFSFIFLFFLNLRQFLLIVSLELLKQRVGVFLGVEPEFSSYFAFVDDLSSELILRVIEEQVFFIDEERADERIFIHDFDGYFF